MHQAPAIVQAGAFARQTFSMLFEQNNSSMTPTVVAVIGSSRTSNWRIIRLVHHNVV